MKNNSLCGGGVLDNLDILSIILSFFACSSENLVIWQRVNKLFYHCFTRIESVPDDENFLKLLPSLEMCDRIEKIRIYQHDNDSKFKVLNLLVSKSFIWPRLVDFSVWESNITDNDIVAISPVLSKCSRLKILDISHNAITIDCLNALSTVLCACTRLEVLDISWNKFEYLENESFLLALKSSNLKEFYASGSNIGADGDDDWFFDALQGCTNIKQLDLSCNGIGNQGAILAVSLLEKCPKLKYVDLSNNSIPITTINWVRDEFSKHTHVTLII